MTEKDNLYFIFLMHRIITLLLCSLSLSLSAQTLNWNRVCDFAPHSVLNDALTVDSSVHKNPVVAITLSGSGCPDYAIVKYNQLGDTLWMQRGDTLPADAVSQLSFNGDIFSIGSVSYADDVWLYGAVRLARFSADGKQLYNKELKRFDSLGYVPEIKGLQVFHPNIFLFWTPSRIYWTDTTATQWQEMPLGSIAPVQHLSATYPTAINNGDIFAAKNTKLYRLSGGGQLLDSLALAFPIRRLSTWQQGPAHVVAIAGDTVYQFSSELAFESKTALPAFMLNIPAVAHTAKQQRLLFVSDSLALISSTRYTQASLSQFSNGAASPASAYDVDIALLKVVMYGEKTIINPFTGGYGATSIDVYAVVKNLSTDTLRNVIIYYYSFNFNCMAVAHYSRHTQLRIAPNQVDTIWFGTGYSRLGPSFPTPPVNEKYTRCFHVYAPNSRIEQDTTNNVSCASIVLTDISETEVISLQIFPQPAGDAVRISLPIQPLPTATLEVFDMCGRLLLTQSAQQENTLSLTAMPAGLYTVLLRDGTQVYRGKLLKE